MKLKYLKLRERTYSLASRSGTAMTSVIEYGAPDYEIELQGSVVTVTGADEVLVLPFSRAAYGLADKSHEQGRKGKR